MKLRIAQPQEIETAINIIDEGKAFLKSQGIDQWQKGYPDRACIEADIENKKSPVGTFMNLRMQFRQCVYGALYIQYSFT